MPWKPQTTSTIRYSKVLYKLTIPWEHQIWNLNKWTNIAVGKFIVLQFFTPRKIMWTPQKIIRKKWNALRKFDEATLFFIVWFTSNSCAHVKRIQSFYFGPLFEKHDIAIGFGSMLVHQMYKVSQLWCESRKLNIKIVFGDTRSSSFSITMSKCREKNLEIKFFFFSFDTINMTLVRE